MILVTGHKGFIGSRLYKRMSRLWRQPVGIDLKDGQNLLTCELPKDIHLIYHLAAQSSVEASWHDPLHDLDNIRIIARLVKEYPDAKIIYANSCASMDVVTPYGFSKWASREYLDKFHGDYVDCVFPNIYGEGSASVVDIFRNKSVVPIFGDGLAVRDYVHVDDIVEGLLKAQNWPTGTYFMGSGVGTKVIDLAGDKGIQWLPARKEAREVIVQNTCPDWWPTMKVLDYVESLYPV